MSFISNADHVTLGDGVYHNIAGNFNVHNHFYGFGRNRDRNEIRNAPDSLLITGAPARKRRRRDEDAEDGIETIQSKHLKLTHEIDSGPGYLFASGRVKDRAVIVKVFNEGPRAKKHLKSTVALSKGLLHPNLLRLEGVSSPVSSTHFMVYENAHRKTADGPLAAALEDNLTKSITLGFKMIAGLSAGINHLSVQGISMATLGEENFDVFLDIDDRFLISINPRMSAESDAADDRQGEDAPTRAWSVFNALCQKVLRSANRVLHDDYIERKPVILDLVRARSVPQKSFLSPTLASPESFDADVSEPRREYVWRPSERGQQSLASVARRISRQLDLKLSPSINKVSFANGQSPHRCAGYVREEITLATTTVESAVVSHDAPSPFETCFICGEVVGFPVLSFNGPELYKYRTGLNNAAQGWGQRVQYADSQSGPLNHPTWASVVYLNEVEYGRGAGSTRGSARERGARQALIALGIIQG
ncbi:hypothetical protein B0H19DRAFT_1377604 [Mycena capillaripes]|nr:hypothetical protein B0H19DRAFT_1377604 [Mycena capillaripes]